MLDLKESPHRRFNPLTGEWVLVSAHRTERPWLGQKEKTAKENIPEHDVNCYLCPGVSRVSGKQNPDYTGTFVFPNDFPALLPETGEPNTNDSDDIFRWQDVRGTSRVICYSPRHDLTIAHLPTEKIVGVIETWSDQSRELGRKYKWVQIFENKGQSMGASNPHPHGQIWAGDFIPTEVMKEDKHQESYYQKHGRPLLLDYVNRELEENTRIICENDSWIAAVPFWAVWPFESLVLPKQPIESFTGLNSQTMLHLAQILKSLLRKYDQLFDIPFPYSMGWHCAPSDDKPNDHWTLHAHFYPPLLRSATVRKFLVGYEMLAESQRDLTAESVAERLKRLPA